MANRKEDTKELINYLFWTLVLQGIVFLGLGILILLYPPILFALVAVSLIWIGVSAFILAWRVKKFRDIDSLVYGTV